MTTLLRTADVSNHNGPFEAFKASGFGAKDHGYLRKTPAFARPFTSAELSCLEQNLDFLIIRGSLESQALITMAKGQFQSWRTTGKSVGGYLWGYGFDDPVAVVADWHENYDALVDSKICWVDIEDEASFESMSMVARQAWMRAIIRAIWSQDYEAGIYSSPYFWSRIMGNMDLRTLGRSVYGWGATWNGMADVASVLPFGNAVMIGHQYSAGEGPCGMPLDESEFDGDAIMASIQGSQDGPEFATEDELQRENAVLVQRFGGIGTLAPHFREMADILDEYCGPDAPASETSGVASLIHGSNFSMEFLPEDRTVSRRAEGTVDANPTVKQILLGYLADLLSPEFQVAALASLADWLAGLKAGAPVTWLVVAQAVIFAFLAGVRAVKAMHGMTGLAMVLRSAGLIGPPHP